MAEMGSTKDKNKTKGDERDFNSFPWHCRWVQSE